MLLTVKIKKSFIFPGNEDSTGVLKLSILHLLASSSSVEISAVELYKEDYRDLMSPQNKIAFEYTNGIWKGCSRSKLSQENLDSILKRIKHNLSRANNGENAASSRGHCFVYLDAIVGNSSKR